MPQYGTLTSTGYGTYLSKSSSGSDSKTTFFCSSAGSLTLYHMITQYYRSQFEFDLLNAPSEH